MRPQPSTCRDHAQLVPESHPDLLKRQLLMLVDPAGDRHQQHLQWSRRHWPIPTVPIFPSDGPFGTFLETRIFLSVSAFASGSDLRQGEAGTQQLAQPSSRRTAADRRTTPFLDGFGPRRAPPPNRLFTAIHSGASHTLGGLWLEDTHLVCLWGVVVSCTSPAPSRSSACTC